LFGHVLTIWRWGRQNADQLRKGKPLGSYEVWAQWCRDPLISLDARDPIDRLANIKAADPKRKRIQTVFETWWAAHKDEELPAKDLDQAVIQAIDAKAGFRDGEFHYSRQYVARWLGNHTNTRVGGFVLTSATRGPDSKPVSHFKLLQQQPGQPPTPQQASSPNLFSSADTGNPAVAFMITRKMKQQLRERGYSDDQIRGLTPNQAHEILRAVVLDDAAVQTLALRYISHAYSTDGRVQNADSLEEADAELRAIIAKMVSPECVTFEFQRVLNEVATNPNPGPRPDVGPVSDN
jgi:hypothetical protein